MSLVLYYSLSGNSRRVAGKFAEENGCALVEVKSKAGKFAAFSEGLIKSFRNEPMSIEPLTLPAYDSVDVFAPVWGGGVAPPMIAGLALLARGTKVALHLTSSSGKHNIDRVEALMQKLGLELVSCEDIMAITMKGV